MPMIHDLTVNVVSIGIVLLYIEYRLTKFMGPMQEGLLQRFEKQITKVAEVTMERIRKPEEHFVCYYCGQMFPISQKETLGNYEYCKEHGTKRKQNGLAEMRKAQLREQQQKEQRHDRTTWVPAADSRRDANGNHEQLPWLSDDQTELQYPVSAGRRE